MARASATRCRSRLRSALLASAALLTGTPVAASPVTDLQALSQSINLSLLQGPGTSESAQDLYLEVVLNGVPTHRVMHFAQTADGRLLAWPPNLADVGLKVEGTARDRYQDLAALDGLDARYDLQTQRLYLEAASTRLNLRPQSFSAAAEHYWPATVSPGALLNYDLFATSTAGRQTAAVATELRAFSRYGVIDSTGLSRFAERDSRAYTRLDTTWTRSDQEDLWALSVGDYISGSLAWSRPTRLGGVQWRRDFGLQPGLITQPLPQFFGQAALPSSIELYVNGVRQYRGEVLPGPFQIDAVPNIRGTGQAQVVLTDALGRSQTLDFGFYNASRLLRTGFSDYAVELGAVRRAYGLESFSYRDEPVTSGSLRYGLREWLTLEGHAEASTDLALGGGGAVVSLGRAGTVNGAYALSEHDRGRGQQASVGYTWTAAGFTVDYQLTRAFDDYRDLAADEGRAPPQRAERALLAYGLGHAGSLSLNYTRLDTIEDGRFRVLGANYSAQLPGTALAFFVGGSRNLDDDHDNSVFAGLSLSFGPQLSAGLAQDRNRGEDSSSVYVSRPLAQDGGYGWNLRAQRGEGRDQQQAELAYRGDRGQISGGLWRLDGHTMTYASASGGLVWMDDQAFASRRVDDAFALVSTEGLAGVPVLLENRPIGVTDARGHYLLTGLSAWQPNQVSIEPLQLPPQVQVERTQSMAVPADRAGVRIAFGLRTVRAALLTLQDDKGQPLPLGTRVRRGADDTAPVQVGYDGQVYLEHLSTLNAIIIDLDGQPSCRLHVEIPETETGIAAIGPLRCPAAENRR